MHLLASSLHRLQPLNNFIERIFSDVMHFSLTLVTLDWVIYLVFDKDKPNPRVERVKRRSFTYFKSNICEYLVLYTNNASHDSNPYLRESASSYIRVERLLIINHGG